MNHIFHGKWITDSEFFGLKPRNVFHRQLDKADLPCDEHRNRHILFRKKFKYCNMGSIAKIYISADDYYKLYINGTFAAQGPAPSYHFQQNYNIIDISKYLRDGENTIAIHTLYQGLINRVWQSGDNRHGLILDLISDNRIIISSDETFKTHRHSAYTEAGIIGYNTQFAENYDSTAAEVDFYKTDFDDSDWEYAKIHKFADYRLKEQKSHMLEFENIKPIKSCSDGNTLTFDFGSNYIGYLNASVKGRQGGVVTVRCGQELNEDGAVRFNLRANCAYNEKWILSDGENTLDWFDFKSFRYAELILPADACLLDISLTARHYPFKLKASLKNEFSKIEDLKKIWQLCIHTQKYGVQEVIQDCMDREKGFYVGDGCYTALTNMILTQDDSMVRKLIDDAFSSDFITDTLVTCINCSFMQEIAEYPLILIFLVLWHYNFTHNKEYLKANRPKVIKLLEAYRQSYEKNYLIRDLDKWCVVEWPENFRQGYDVRIMEGEICREPHISINAYYIEAIKTANRISEILELGEYRNISPLISSFNSTFFDKEKHLYRDGVNTSHISLVGNIFPFAFGLCPDEKFYPKIINMLDAQKISSLSLFCTFPALLGLIKNGRGDLLEKALSDRNAWLKMIDEGATTTFEVWSKDAKWNTSLFHLTMTYAAVFMADIDYKKLFA